MASQVFSEILLKRVKKDYTTAFKDLNGSFFRRYKSFVLAKVIESLGVKLPEWCVDYFDSYSIGFGEVTFHTGLLNDNEKEDLGLKLLPYSEAEINS